MKVHSKSQFNYHTQSIKACTLTHVYTLSVYTVHIWFPERFTLQPCGKIIVFHVVHEPRFCFNFDVDVTSIPLYFIRMSESKVM